MEHKENSIECEVQSVSEVVHGLWHNSMFYVMVCTTHAEPPWLLLLSVCCWLHRTGLWYRDWRVWPFPMPEWRHLPWPGRRLQLHMPRWFYWSCVWYWHWGLRASWPLPAWRHLCGPGRGIIYHVESLVKEIVFVIFEWMLKLCEYVVRPSEA